MKQLLHILIRNGLKLITRNSLGLFYTLLVLDKRLR